LLKNFKNRYSQQAIDSACLVKTDVWAVKNFFETAVLEDILTQIEIETEWCEQLMQENYPRRALYESNGLIDNIWCILNDLDFSRFGLRFMSAAIWKDSAGYTITQHTDNDGVKGAMQIYLNDIPQNLGTWFEEIEMPFIKNTGYIMNNTTKPKHGMKEIVPDHMTRYSLYAWFDIVKSNKEITKVEF
jgi:hypothetical protein